MPPRVVINKPQSPEIMELSDEQQRAIDNINSKNGVKIDRRKVNPEFAYAVTSEDPKRQGKEITRYNTNYDYEVLVTNANQRAAYGDNADPFAMRVEDYQRLRKKHDLVIVGKVQLKNIRETGWVKRAMVTV